MTGWYGEWCDGIDAGKSESVVWRVAGWRRFGENLLRHDGIRGGGPGCAGRAPGEFASVAAE